LLRHAGQTSQTLTQRVGNRIWKVEVQDGKRKVNMENGNSDGTCRSP
jgi:hypothetical protein